MGQSKCVIAKRKKRTLEAPTPTSNEFAMPNVPTISNN
jgi:hypothetical protein